MSKTRKGKPLSYDQAVSELDAAQQALSEVAATRSPEYDQCVQHLHDLYAIMARDMARRELARRRYNELVDIVNKGASEPKMLLASRLTDDPSVTKELLEAVANGEVTTKHEERKYTPHNMVILIGGMARITAKSEAQVLAAIRYSNLFDLSQHGGARAVDYEQVRVDTSGPRQDQITAAQDDARRALADAREALKPRAASIVDLVVIGGASIRKLAEKLGYPGSGKGRRNAEAELMAAIDVLVKHFNLDPPARSRAHHWRDGERPPMFPDDQEAA